MSFHRLLTYIVWYGCCTVLTLILGLVPFLLGFGVQALCPCRIPMPWLVLLSTVAFFALYHLGYPPAIGLTGNHDTAPGSHDYGLLASLLVSLWLFDTFVAVGAAMLRRLWMSRFA